MYARDKVWKLIISWWKNSTKLVFLQVNSEGLLAVIISLMCLSALYPFLFNSLHASQTTFYYLQTLDELDLKYQFFRFFKRHLLIAYLRWQSVASEECSPFSFFCRAALNQNLPGISCSSLLVYSITFHSFSLLAGIKQTFFYISGCFSLCSQCPTLSAKCASFRIQKCFGAMSSKSESLPLLFYFY